jgi:hypothetical protein
MKINAARSALSCGISAILLWTVCSLLVLLAPTPMTAITGHMLHTKMDEFVWHLTWPGYLVGLVSWTVCAAITGWLITSVYNWLSGKTGSQMA